MKKHSIYLSILVLSAFSLCSITSSFSQAPNIEWQKCLGGTGNESPRNMKQTSDGGCIISGITSSLDGDITSNHGGTDCWIVKLDVIGTVEWQKCLGGTSTDDAKDIQETSDGGFIIACESLSSNGDVTGNHGQSDYWIVKLNSTGVLEWQKSLGGSFTDCPKEIQQTTDGGFIVVGRTNSFSFTPGANGDVEGVHGMNNDDFWVVKLSSTGTLEWQKCLGGTSNDSAESVKLTIDGGYLIVGTSSSTDGDVTNNHGYNDIWLIKLNSVGVLEWEKSIGGTGVEYATEISPVSDGGFIIAGQTSSNDGDVSGFH